MRQYSEEFKATIIAKMLPPNNATVPDLADETQIPKDTLYCWRSKASKDAEGVAVTSTSSGELSSEEKFAIVVETASLNETELSEYCRHRGLYPQQLEVWRTRCSQANAVVSSKRERAKLREHKQQIKALQRELRHKEKALAEAAALLMLQKKVRAIFMEPEDEKSRWSNDERSAL